MNTMFDVFKERLPEGLCIIKAKDRAGSSRTVIEVEYDFTRVKTFLPKTCTPGCEINVCDFAICSAMMEVALRRGDLDMAKFWINKQTEIKNC